MPLDLTRSFLTIILPGIVAIAPWMLLVVAENPSAGELYKSWEVPFHVVAFSFAITVGAIIECFGSWFECRWDEAMAAREEPGIAAGWVARDWHTYLGQKFGDKEPVVYRYLSRKVTTLYFEIGMMFSVPIALLGVGVLVLTQGNFHWCVPLLAVASAVGFFLVFGRFAKDSHRVLCITRRRYCAMLESAPESQRGR